MIEITKNLLYDKLSLKLERHLSEEDEVKYKKFLKIASNRIIKLLNKVSKSKAYESGKISRNDVLIDI